MRSTSWRGFKALLGALWGHRALTVAGLLALLIANLAQLSIPFLSRNVIDALQRGQPSSAWMPSVAWTAGLALVVYAVRALWRYCFYGVACLCDVDLRRRIYQRAVSLSLEQRNQASLGRILSLASSDVLAVRTALAFALMSGLEALLSSLTSVAALVAIQPRLAAITLAPFVLLCGLMSIILHFSYTTWDQVQTRFDTLTETTRQSIAGMRVVRSTVQSEGEVQAFSRQATELYRRFLTHVKVDALYSPTILAMAGISSGLLLALGGAEVVAGRMSLGEFAAFAAFLGQLTWPVTAAAWTLSLLQRGAASMERILEHLALTGEPNQPLRKLAGLGHLRAVALSYRYPQSVGPALENLSFDLAPGGSLGLVGEVGAGKSTLLRLLMRLHEPEAGTLWLDGLDVTTLNLGQLREQIAWVDQEAFLFSQSIEDNLRLAAPEASFEELVAAARQACLHEEILKFPQGYATLLGERGVSLSGGQKQRLCLARALLKKAPIVVLDDTLSAVDAATEQNILEGLRARRGKQSLIVVSHRVSALRDLDEILVLEQGRVVARGRHEQLALQPGLYRRLLELQSGEAR